MVLGVVLDEILLFRYKRARTKMLVRVRPEHSYSMVPLLLPIASNSTYSSQ